MRLISISLDADDTTGASTACQAVLFSKNIFLTSPNKLVKYQLMGKPVMLATLQEAQDLLRFCLAGGGAVVPGCHFRRELVNEGLAFEDAWMVLATGQIYAPPEEDIKTGERKYRVEGYESGGKYLVIVFSFKTITLAFLITVFSVEEKRRSV
jgi:uncharacterized DUF497 family protein